MSFEDASFLELAQFPVEQQNKSPIDLRSDTVTKPTAAMRQAMAECAVDDAVIGDDPSVLALEKLVAKLAGKEDAVFVASGTMSNLIAVMSHCDVRGSEAIVGDSCHIHIHEQGGVATIGGVHCRVIPTSDDGTLPLHLIENAVRDTTNLHYPISRLICVENTHNVKGGKALPMQWLKDCYALAQQHNLKVHTDGARAWHAATALNLPLADILAYTDTASLCLSKGLGAPAGSILVGPREFIQKARRVRKALGGGMRQMGVLGACGIVAVRDTYLSGALAKDHEKTQVMAKILADTPGVILDPSSVQSNLLYFSVDIPLSSTEDQVTNDTLSTGYSNNTCINTTVKEKKVTAAMICSLAKAKDVLILPTGLYTIRAVMHHQVTEEQARHAAEVISDIITSFGNK